LEVFKTNVVGTALVTQRFLPLLKKKTERKIFNISSILGSIALTTSPGSISPYNVSKAAENMYTKELAEDLRSENFTILAIHPGWVQTDM
jgi:NAD(P)-dependent dehydrogenase (short-subunit alcohol dehydrogenase family)